MRISDWSSDVCSSDLPVLDTRQRTGHCIMLWPCHPEVFPGWADNPAYATNRRRSGTPMNQRHEPATREIGDDDAQTIADPHGRASGRERVCQDVEITVVVGTIKKNKKHRYK